MKALLGRNKNIYRVTQADRTSSPLNHVCEPSHQTPDEGSRRTRARDPTTDKQQQQQQPLPTGSPLKARERILNKQIEEARTLLHTEKS